MHPLMVNMWLLQSIKGEKSGLGNELREGDMEEDEHAVHQFQVQTGKEIMVPVVVIKYAVTMMMDGRNKDDGGWESLIVKLMEVKVVNNNNDDYCNC